MSSPTEETKLLDLQSQSQTAQWFWQSDVDPWREADSTKWKWQQYSYDYSDCIEEAFSLNQKVVDLGDYEIDLKKNLQVNKKDRNKLRRVKREVNAQRRSRFMLEMPTLYVIDKPQKTIHAAFGNVQHFLNYIMKRTPEAYRLYHRLKELNLESKLSEYTDVVLEVTMCIQKGGECREKMIGTRSNNFIQEAKDIIVEIESKYKADSNLKLKDFFKMILRVYTMESFICYWLNELLRSENWEEINVLTPYLVCLIYAFQVQEYIIKYQEPQGFRETFKGLFKSKKLNLYRGTALVKDHLHSYHPGNTRFFSWNGVTSTSRSKEQAERFIQHSLKRSKPGEKIGVLFIITADFASAADCEGMIDVSQDSKYSHEQEVIIAPGTVFEVTNFDLNKVQNIYQVNLKLVKKFKNNQKLIGDLHAKILSDEKAILKNMDVEEITKAVQLLEGNQVVKQLEIENCKVSTHLVKLIDNMRKTTNIKKENITLKNNQIEIDGLITLSHYFLWEKFVSICTDNKITFDGNIRPSINLKELSLEKNILKIFLDKNRITELSETILTESQITNVNLAIKDLLISQNKLKALIIATQILTGLQSLTLDFESNQTVSVENLIDLSQAMKTWKFLKYLSLNFSYCSNLQDAQADVQLSDFMDGLILLESLQNLSLDFRDCKLISDQSMNALIDTLKIRTTLQHLSLGLGDCKKISDNSLSNLANVLAKFKALKYLSLEINHNEEDILEQNFSSLTSTLKPFGSFKHLSLDFSGLKILTDKKVNSPIEILKVDNLLNQVSLSFKDFKQVSERTLVNLKNAITSFVYLTHFSLNFRDCHQISDQGLNSLLESIIMFPDIQDLFLDLSDCKEISNQVLNSLTRALKSMKSLKRLSLNFRNCIQISDQDLAELKDVIRVLTSLEYLSLDFGYWHSLQIADEGSNRLIDPMKLNSQLKHLYIDFGNSGPIPQQGINNLKEAIKSLTFLQHLSIDFKDSKQISAQSVLSLSETLKKLKLLQHISIDFCGCQQISDQGLNSLNDAVKPLVSLQYLSLNFWGYEKIFS